MVETNIQTFEPYDFTWTAPPNSQWSSGTNATAQPESSAKILIDPYAEDRDLRDNYRLLVSSIVPRPIALVSTVDTEGRANLAPFSFFNVVSADPPVFALGISHVTGEKDTLRNLRETGECTISIISEWYTEAANATSINAPSGSSEWEYAGLTKEPAQKVKAPLVGESAFSIECKVMHTHELFSKREQDKQTSTVLLLEGLFFHVQESVLNEDGKTIDMAKLRPVARLGGISYGSITSGYALSRPEWEDKL